MPLRRGSDYRENPPDSGAELHMPNFACFDSVLSIPDIAPQDSDECPTRYNASA